MFWLTLQMWMLLTAAFLLGIASGWWIFRTRTQEAYSRAPVYDEYDDYVSQRNQNGDEADDLMSPTQSTNFNEDENFDEDESTHLGTIQDTNEIKPREKIYERDLPAHQMIANTYSENLADLPDIESDMQDISSPIASQALKTAPLLYSKPIKGEANDLKKIKGIGKTLEKTLNGIGIFYYEQIASWDEEEINWIDNQIDFPGRVRREKWVDQSRTLANEESSHAAKATLMSEARDIDAIAKTEHEDSTECEDSFKYDNNDAYEKKVLNESNTSSENSTTPTTEYIKQEALISEQPQDISHPETINEQTDEIHTPKQDKGTIQTDDEYTGDNSLPESMLDRLRAKNKR